MAGQHNFDEHARKDAVRDQHFVGEGFVVLRFWNTDVDQNLEAVLYVIDETLQSRTVSGSSLQD